MTDDKDKKDLFQGFDALSSLLYREDGSEKERVLERESDEDVPEPEENEEEVIKNTSKNNGKDNSDTEVDSNEDENNKSLNKDDDFTQYEEEVSSYFATELADKLGIEKLPDDLKINKLDDVVDLLIKVVQDNSRPNFSSEELEELNEFVSNGGNLKDFIKENYSYDINIDSLDMSSERDQKSILREHMINQGYKEDKIKRVIDRYEDAGILQDQAEEALDLVKEFRTKKAEKLLAEQKKFAEDEEKAKQQFVDTVYNTVDQLKMFNGLTVSDSQRNALKEYMFKVDKKTGLTEMQKDNQDPKERINNTIGMAFFKKFGNQLLLENKKQGEKKAYEDIRQKFKAGKEKRSAGGNTGFNETSEPLLKMANFLQK